MLNSNSGRLRAACIRALLFAATWVSGSAQAQHASDDPLASADDAFGLTLGLESIGMYNPGNIRGFNPQTAGNVRIDGVYFDQQAGLSNRVVEGSTIRIGVSEIGYAFPAPTGIVDYQLRNAGDGTPAATILASVGPFEAHGISIDGTAPVISSDLLLPIGASYQISTSANAAANPGYTSKYYNLGATPQWKPASWLAVRAIFDWQLTTDAKTLPVVFTAGDFLPPLVKRSYYGQNWALGRNQSTNVGAIVNLRMGPFLSLRAGVFRSVNDNPASYTDIYDDVTQAGVADHLVVANPDQVVASNSGEIRLIGHVTDGAWAHSITLMARGRETSSVYGGSDVVDLGTAQLGDDVQLAKPSFAFTTRDRDVTDLWSTGVAYQLQWQAHGDIATGIQHEWYEESVTGPDSTGKGMVRNPLREYATTAVNLFGNVTAYAGYTQGLEASGVAPGNAENRGTVLPASLTWQAESGLRYAITPNVKLIAGVFEIEKPYFNLDLTNVDRQLASQHASGVELSLSGEIVPNLHVTAGALLGQVRIVGPNLAAEGIGPVAFGQPYSQGILNASYTIPQMPNLSFDITFSYYGESPGSLDDVARNPPWYLYNIGARYKFESFGNSTSLRVQIQNLSNFNEWNYYYTPGFSQSSPRTVFAYLTKDI
jgi:iron complex outermembrane receptor protein